MFAQLSFAAYVWDKLKIERTCLLHPKDTLCNGWLLDLKIYRVQRWTEEEKEGTLTKSLLRYASSSRERHDAWGCEQRRRCDVALNPWNRFKGEQWGLHRCTEEGCKGLVCGDGRMPYVFQQHSVSYHVSKKIQVSSTNDLQSHNSTNFKLLDYSLECKTNSIYYFDLNSLKASIVE